MISAAELRVLVGVYGIPEAKRELVKFDADLHALASSDPTVTLHADVDRTGFEDFGVLKAIAEEGVTSTLEAAVDNAGFEAFGVKKAIAEEGVATTLEAEIADFGFEEAALKKAIFEDPVTTELHADSIGFEKVFAQLAAIRTAASKPIVQEVELRIDKSSLATLGAEEAMVGAVNGNGNGHTNGNGDGGFLGALIGASGGGGGRGILPTVLWGGHSPGRGGPLLGRLLLGGGLLAGAGSLGAFAGLGAEHALFTGLGVAGSAGAGALGGGLIGAGALGAMAVGGGSDLAVVSSTIADTKELGKATAAVDQAMALYGEHSKQAARAVAHLKLLEQELGGGPGVHAEAQLAGRAHALDKFWDRATQDARVQAAHVLDQVVGLGHRYVPLVAHAAEQNLSIVDKDIKPLFHWLEGPEGVGIFEHLEDEFQHNLPHAMHAFDQGAQFVLKTINDASRYTGGLTEGIDAFFTKWNEPQNFSRWEGEIGHLVGDLHLWLNLLKEAGRDTYDLFSNDAHTGNAVVETLTHMLHRLGEWERSTAGKEELHNLFTVHREEVVALLHVIPPLIGAISPIYMTMAPALTSGMTEVLGVVANFLKLLDETGPITRWGLGLTLIATKLFGFKTIFGGLGGLMWGPFKSLLAKAPLIGGFFETQVSETEALTAATEGLTTAVGELTGAYEAMGMSARTAEGVAAAGGAEGVAGGLFASSAAGAEKTAATGVGGAASAGAASFGGAPLLAAAGVGYTVLELVSHRAGDAAEKASDRLKLLDEEGKSTLGTLGRLGEGLPKWGAGSIIGWAEAGDKAHRLLQMMELMHLSGEKRSRQLLDEGKSLLHDLELTKQQKTEYEHMLTKAQQANVQVEAHSGIHSLESGHITRLSDIKAIAQHNAEEIALGWKQGSEGWRRATGENMVGVVEAIRAGEKQGAITTKEGQQEIAHYLREYHLVTGQDPFHIAEAFTSSWREAGHVSETGISNALAELRKMPPVAQAIAEQTMLRQVREYERGGQLAKGTFSRLRSAITTELERTREHGGAQVAHFAAEFSGSFGMLSTNVAGALEAIGANVGSLLSKLGAHNPLEHFTLHYAHTHGMPAGAGSQYVHELPELHGHQSGGFTVPGNSTGDRHPYLLPQGSFILNRRATAAYGLQNGGMSPVMLESGERVFPPHEVKAVGAHELERINVEVPRFEHFQKGGQLGSEPQLVGGGAEALHTLGQRAIHDAYLAAARYVGAHHPHGAAVATPGGGGDVIAQIGRVLFANGFNKIGAAGIIGNAYRESGWNPAAIGTGGGGLWGFTSGAISLAALQAAAKRGGVPWTDVAFQTGFMLRHGGLGLRGALNSAGSAGAAARIFMEQWERPGIPALADREAGARRALAMGYQAGGMVDPRAHLSPAERGSYLQNKWKGARLLAGLIPQTEHELGVPRSHHHAHEHATASEAVHWAMRRLGQTNDYGYPGEWCGAFLAADMKAIGLPVPSGYPSAASWANYGTALGRNHIQAGAILDYGSAHVALAISSNEQIQGNDMHGAVGTSGIGGVIGGSPLTAVRWPPYGTGPGAGSAPSEPKVPAQFHGAQTAALSLSVPKSMHAVKAEIAKWTQKLEVYERAVKLAAGRPKLQQALHRNVMRIQKYLRELDRARHKLRVERARRRYTAKLARSLGRITHMETEIEGARRGYEIASQTAEQIVSLEPREPILPANATEAQEAEAQKAYAAAYETHVNGKERPAYQRVLGHEADWRNLILQAESKAMGMESNWELDIRGREAEIHAIPKHYAEVKAAVRAWKSNHPGAKHLPSELAHEFHNATDELAQLPQLRFEERSLRKSLGEARGEFYGGTPRWTPVQPPVAPLVGSGSLEQSLQEVQGIHWPDSHEAIAALPGYREAGHFGGAIWQTQEAVEELGLKIQQASASLGGSGSGGSGAGSSATSTEREHLLDELLLQANQREMLRGIERQTLGAAHLPYAGAYAGGGVVAALVGEQGPEIAAFPTGTRVHTAGETSAMLAPRVTVNVYEDEGTAEVEIDDEKVEAVVHRMDRRGARSARRGLARAGQ